MFSFPSSHVAFNVPPLQQVALSMKLEEGVGGFSGRRLKDSDQSADSTLVRGPLSRRVTSQGQLTHPQINSPAPPTSTYAATPAARLLAAVLIRRRVSLATRS